MVMRRSVIWKKLRRSDFLVDFLRNFKYYYCDEK